MNPSVSSIAGSSHVKEIASGSLAKIEGPDVRHVGPVAQDLYEAFRTGADDKHLAALDSAGVALAAIKGLNQKLEEQLRQKDAEWASQQEQINELVHRLDILEQELATCETK